jgi:thymidylate synthase (FAD)
MNLVLEFLIRINKMKLFTKPRVELVGRQVMDINGIVAFLQEHDLVWPELQKKLDSNMDLGDRDCEWLIEMAGRGCYMSFGGKGRSHEDHIRHLIEVQHGSVLEHANFNFHIWGVSRSLTHELVRHRAGMAYSQLSQRYVDSSDCAFVIPPAIQKLQMIKPEVYLKWLTFIGQAQELYSELTEELGEMYSDIESKTEKRKKARQAARSVLPNATETKIFTSMNGRAVRHFIEMRANAAADLEIRMLAVDIFKIMEREFPLVVYGIELIKLSDGTEAVESKFRKV